MSKAREFPLETARRVTAREVESARLAGADATGAESRMAAFIAGLAGRPAR